MSDEPVPFPTPETGEGEKKPRRRRGGVRRRKPRGTSDEPRTIAEPSAAATAAPAPVAPAPVSPSSVSHQISSSSSAVGTGPGPVMPTRSSVEQRLSLFIDFENIALGVRDAQDKKFNIKLVLSG